MNREDGFGLIEVMVSALLLLIVTASVLKTIDSAQQTSGRLAADAVSADLAQQDQERLRSMRTASLANLLQTRTVAVKGKSYSVESEASFVSDTTQTPGCTTTSSANYIRITSSVRSPSATTPTAITSIVNPAVGTFGENTGGLVVKILGAAGGPIVGVDVKISQGSTSYTQNTSTEGCAFFAFVPTGAYTITYGETGYVSLDGVKDVSLPASVSANAISSYQTTYDQAAAMTVSVGTRVGTSVTGGTYENLTLSHPNLPGGSGVKLFPAVNAPASSVAASPLFPFTSPYSYYSGTCTANALPSSLASQLPTGYSTSLQTTPGTAYPNTSVPSLKLFEPALVPDVKFSGNTVGGARIKYTQTDGGCANTLSQTANAAGVVPDPGIPYGTWTVCAEAKVNGKSYLSSAIQTGVKNDSISGKTVSLGINDTGSAAPCA